MIDEDLIKIMENTECWVIDLEKNTYNEIVFLELDSYDMEYFKRFHRNDGEDSEDYKKIYCSIYNSLEDVANGKESDFEEFIIKPEHFFETTDHIEFLRNEGILSDNLLIEYKKTKKMEIDKR